MYATIANGQSLGSAVDSAEAYRSVVGLKGAELQMLVSTDGADPY